MHWGTFILTDEDPTEPPVRVHAEMVRRGLDPNAFCVVELGETLSIPKS
jgi:N-acyl-phosphatidylethanolamine-hydrolysing phospholipase D